MRLSGREFHHFLSTEATEKSLHSALFLFPPQGQTLDEQLSAAVRSRGDKTKDLSAATPTGAGAVDASTVSTPGVPMPPNPPPIPQGGIPVPPPPPPALPGGATESQKSNLKRVNWEKIHGTEGTIWREVF